MGCHAAEALHVIVLAPTDACPDVPVQPDRCAMLRFAVVPARGSVRAVVSLCR